jgi:hypothetical protein
MNIRALSTTVLIAALGAFSPHAFGQDKTVASADLEKAAMGGLRATFFMGSAEVDRDSTIFRKMSKLQDDCKAKVIADIEAAPPVASADMPNAIIAIKILDQNCLTAGVAADPSLARLKANFHFPTPR